MDSSLQASSIRSASPPPSPYTISAPTSQDASAYGGLSGAGGRPPASNTGALGQPLPAKRGLVDERRDTDGRADQIVQHFYAKTCAVVSQARMTHLEDTTSANDTSPLSSGSGTGPGKRTSRANTPPLRRGASAGAGAAPARRTNRWFNLELSETDHFRQELKTWRSVSSLLSPAPSPLPSPSTSISAPLVPPMVLDIILDTCNMTPNQVLVLSDQRGRRVRVDPSPSPPQPGASTSGVRSPRTARPNVILERWTLQLVGPFRPESPPELPSVYKQAIIVFRALFAFVRGLPAAGLYRRLARGIAGVGGAGLQIGCRMSMGDESEREGEVAVGVPIAERAGEPTTEIFSFSGVQTPIGTLLLNCTYRLNADFAVEAIETLLSSTFIDQDFFRPTMARYHQEVLSGRPGSLPIRGPTTASPPGQRQSYGSLSSRHQVSTAVPFPSTSSAVTEAPPSSEPETPPESASSGGRFGSYGGGVEPAFVSLSRARGQSYSGGIHRVGVSSSPTAQPIRRPSLTSGSASSGSPIFRAGSYLSSPPMSSSPLTGPTSNINRLSSSPRSVPQSSAGTSATVTGQGSFSRSPLAPSQPQPMPTSPRPILASTSQPMRPYSSGSYSRSYGRGSSGGSVSGGESAQWGGRASGGRLSFSRPTAVIHHTDSADAEGQQKRFLESAEDDSDDITSFLGLIDARPELVRAATAATAASAILSKTQADDQLRRLAASVQLPESGGLGSGIVRASSVRSRNPIEEEPAREPSTSSSPRLPSHLNPSRFARRPDTAPASSPSPPYFPPTPSFPKYVPRSTQVTTGFVLQQPSSSSTSLSGTEGERSYGGEEEAVGRLELTDDDAAGGDEVVPARGRWSVEEMPPPPPPTRRDRTPSSATGQYREDYYQAEDDDASSPEISWMG